MEKQDVIAFWPPNPGSTVCTEGKSAKPHVENKQNKNRMGNLVVSREGGIGGYHDESHVYLIDEGV